MSRQGFLIWVFIAALAGGMIAMGGYSLFVEEKQYQDNFETISEHQEIAMANVKLGGPAAVSEEINFVEAAEFATKAVVHIRSKYEGTASMNGIFGGQPMSQGSGVIISDNGYIATNNHVIENAATLEVTLWDNRRYDAKVVGTDPTTDLALIKIKEKNLTFLPYGDSDEIKTGEWVLAVGNPFNLTSTVTAGIVSAKARNIGILRDENRLQIESFIQTDAAVNPGNSGGALVDLTGRLVGINTAIASNTGSYNGYSFAVPVTLVSKVMDDLLEFGEVQRGLLGVSIRDAALQSQIDDLDVVNGVYVIDVNPNSAADKAGLSKGDIIVGINDRRVDNTSQLQEFVARYRPGDEVSVSYLRGGENYKVDATLKSFDGTTGVIARPSEVDLEGATFEDITSREANELGVRGGVKVTDIRSGKWQEAGVEEGFVVTSIDKSDVDNIEDMRRILRNKVGERIIVLGVSPDGEKSYYSMQW